MLTDTIKKALFLPELSVLHSYHLLHRAPSAHGLSKKLVVSLTSFPPRFPTLAYTIKSLKTQNVRPDRIDLWLCEPDAEKLPKSVLNLKDEVFHINTIPQNLRSFTKLVPALQHFPDAFIVTADDDVFYPADWLEALVANCRESQTGPIGWRGHLIRVDPSGRPLNYSNWQHNVSGYVESARLVLTGVGGIIYPPGVFPPEALDPELFLRLCPKADDLWFYFMTRQNGFVPRTVGKPFTLYNWRGSQTAKLWAINSRDGNDRAMQNLVETFGLPFDPVQETEPH